MDFKKQKPIYLQITDHLMDEILVGQYSEGGRIPSVRDIAASMGVNPNTVVRSFDSLQSNGVIFNRRGMGYFVSDNAKDIIFEKRRQQFLEEELPSVKQQMKLLNISFEQVKNILI